MTLTFSFGDSPERIPAADVDAHIPVNVNHFEVGRIRSQLRLAQCREHRRHPREIHVRMIASLPELTIQHDCGVDGADCQALSAEIRRLVALPQP